MSPRFSQWLDRLQIAAYWRQAVETRDTYARARIIRAFAQTYGRDRFAAIAGGVCPAPLMAWKPGQSGNPAGSRKRDTGRAALREQITEALPPIIKKLIALARDGDVQAARTLLERVLPPARPEALPIELPDVAAAGTFTEQAEALFKAAVSGGVAPDVAARLLTGVAAAARTTEIDELARRIAALEVEKLL